MSSRECGSISPPVSATRPNPPQRFLTVVALSETLSQAKRQSHAPGQTSRSDIVARRARQRRGPVREAPFRRGRNRFHFVPIFRRNEWDRVESVPAGFMVATRDARFVGAFNEPAGRFEITVRVRMMNSTSCPHVIGSGRGLPGARMSRCSPSVLIPIRGARAVGCSRGTAHLLGFAFSVGPFIIRGAESDLTKIGNPSVCSRLLSER